MVSALQIIEWRLEDLKPYENSPRTHNRAQRRKLLAVLRKFGPLVPIVIDPNGVIVDGHLLHECLRELGYKTVPTVVARSNHPADIRAIRLALNRIPSDASWDRSKLRTEFQFLVDAAYELDLTGFEAPEIDACLKIDTPSIGIIEDTDALITPQGLVISKPGDVVACGAHQIACGDALDRQVALRLLANVDVRMVMTDPPYDVPIDGLVSGTDAVATGEMSHDQFASFLFETFENAMIRLVPGALLFFWTDWRHLDTLMTNGKNIGLNPIDVCVWVKTSPSMESFYRSQHEMCVLFKYGNMPHTNNVKHGRSRSNVWTIRRKASFGADRDELFALHPTVKPVSLLADAILDGSDRGDVIFDLFLGSGSTLIACEEVSRKCFGIEIDPAYLDVAIRRWQKATGKDAVFVDTGEVFDRRADRIAEEAEATTALKDLEDTPNSGDPDSLLDTSEDDETSENDDE